MTKTTKPKDLQIVAEQPFYDLFTKAWTKLAKLTDDIKAYPQLQFSNDVTIPAVFRNRLFSVNSIKGSDIGMTMPLFGFLVADVNMATGTGPDDYVPSFLVYTPEVHFDRRMLISYQDGKEFTVEELQTFLRAVIGMVDLYPNEVISADAAELVPVVVPPNRVLH